VLGLLLALLFSPAPPASAAVAVSLARSAVPGALLPPVSLTAIRPDLAPLIDPGLTLGTSLTPSAVPLLTPLSPSLGTQPLLPAAKTPKAAAALEAFTARQVQAVNRGASPASLTQDLSGFFDGFKTPSLSVAAPAAKSASHGWTDGSFSSPADGAPIVYRSRLPVQDSGAAPKIFVGGLGLPDSFETYFRTGDAESPEYLLTLRGLFPSAWTRTKEVYDSDALDLARMIVLAARERGSSRVDLVLHSYSSLVLQRMLQLGSDPVVAQALGLLRGARVSMMGATTHYGDSETVAGPEFAEMARMIKNFFVWLDAMDAYAENLEAAARINPLLRPQVDLYMASWRMQREGALNLASRQAADMLIGHMTEPWAPEIDSIRQEILARTQLMTRDPGWQEALLRRAKDTSELEFTAEDVEMMRALGIRLDILYGERDQLVPWISERLLPELLGIETPEEAPPAGTALQSEDGLFRFIVVDGDHYFPMKRPAELRELLR